MFEWYFVIVGFGVYVFISIFVFIFIVYFFGILGRIKSNSYMLYLVVDSWWWCKLWSGSFFLGSFWLILGRWFFLVRF